MKIGLITGEFPPMPGGVGSVSRILAETLQRQDHQVDILSCQGAQSGSLPLNTVDNWGLRSIAKIRAWINKIDPDIVNLQYQTAAFDMSPVIHFFPEIINRPLITTFHDLRFPYLFPKAGPLRDWIVTRLARASDGVITTNQEDDQGLSSLPNRRMIPIGSTILRPPAQPYCPSQWRKRAGADDDCFLLGHFGFIKQIKGIDFLVDALARLRHAGRDLRLVFVGGRSNTVDAGKDVPYLRELDRRLKQLDIEDAIHWTGFLPDEDVSAYLSAIDLAVLPFNDGASYRRSSLMAAIHQECAILTTAPIVDVQTFEHGGNMWLVSRNSTVAIEDAIKQLMDDPVRLNRLRNGARALASHFDWDMIARDTASYFQTFL